MSEVADGATEVLSASQMLSQAREAMGLTQDDVAQELFLTPAYIRLIDSDQIDQIAKQAFVRGYLRSYAKMVQLDGDEVVGRYDKSQGAVPQKIEIRGVTQEPVGPTNFTGPVFQTGVLGLVGLVIIIALVWFLSSDEDEQVVVTPPVIEDTSTDPIEQETESFDDPAQFATRDQPVAPAEVESALEETASAGSSGAVSTETESFASLEDAPAIEELSEELTEGLSNEVNAQQPAVVAEDALVSETQISIERVGDFVRVDAGGSDELRFTFTDECWIEIEDGQGEAIYGDLNRTGDELIVTGRAPFEILFGKAPVVKMQYNGEDFDLGPHTTSVETAKVRVGN